MSLQGMLLHDFKDPYNTIIPTFLKILLFLRKQ
jgi:hypothetical protein